MSAVVFHKMAPHETLFLQSTNSLDIRYIASNAFVQFQVRLASNAPSPSHCFTQRLLELQIWDFPGDYDFSQGNLNYGGQSISPEVVFRFMPASPLTVTVQRMSRCTRCPPLQCVCGVGVCP